MAGRHRKTIKKLTGMFAERKAERRNAAMPSPEMQERIRSLEGEGYSRIEIARIIGIHYNKVRLVLGKIRISKGENEFPGHPSGTLENPKAAAVWCVGCGGLVVMPCLKCFLQNRRNGSSGGKG